ncbi:1264_t:CDS:2 [Diversispora eburnea]|uniref:1264_t:CDS:1 n=1 Tax=Diversispora eburnea TaxID=1213867 RepID=A0A9N9AC14_9GLOM|nr:1264_t:CDS:2 [Diversispora eburnea]
MGKSTQEERRQRKNTQDTNNKEEILDDIPEDEKIRLIKSTGILENFKESGVRIVQTEVGKEPKIREIKEGEEEEREGEKRESEEIEEEEGEDPYAHGIVFQAFLYTIPLCAVYCVMDILVHRQYSETVLLFPVATRIFRVSPLLWGLVYYTNKNVSKNWMQLLMFMGSLICGSYLIWVVNNANYIGVMKRCPPLATLWIYFVIQLRLLPSCLSLLGSYIYFKYMGFKL